MKQVSICKCYADSTFKEHFVSRYALNWLQHVIKQRQALTRWITLATETKTVVNLTINEEPPSALLALQVLHQFLVLTQLPLTLKYCRDLIYCYYEHSKIMINTVNNNCQIIFLLLIKSYFR